MSAASRKPGGRTIAKPHCIKNTCMRPPLLQRVHDRDTCVRAIADSFTALRHHADADNSRQLVGADNHDANCNAHDELAFISVHI